MRHLLVRGEFFYSKTLVIVLLTVFLLVSVASASEHSDAGRLFGSAYKDHSNLPGQRYNTSNVGRSTNVVSSSEYPIGNVPANSVKGSAVNPLHLYSREPAPMGIADYGIGPNGSPYEYNTTSFMGIIKIDSLSTYNSSLSYLNYTGGPYGMTFQLNINLQFFNGTSEYVYWVQDVADLNTSSNNIAFIDNVWNLSELNANMHNSTVSGNGTVANSSGTHFYYDCASPSMSGNDVALHYTTKVEFKIDSLITRNNQPEVAFMYNDGYGWITYDNVVFKFVSDLTADYGFVVNGNNYEPDGYTFYDAELILGGPGGGTQTNDNLSNLQLQLEYWNGHNFQQVANAFNFGSDTAEGIHNVVSSGMYYNANGTLFAQVANGNGSLRQIYNRTDIGIINVSTNMSSGTLIINGTSYPFINCDINVTLSPGHYVWELYSSKSVLVAHGDFNLSAGQYLALNSAAIYTATFTEVGLQAGNTWYVNITGNNITYDSGPITITSYSFQLTNGSYTYTIATSNKTYKPSPSSGSFIVNGASVFESITFSLVKYSVTFTESGLPSGTRWYVNVTESNDTICDSGAISGSSFTFHLTNSSYTYTIATSDHTDESSASSGSLTVNGTSISKSVAFSEVKYIVTFTESGLPSGTTWYVNLSNGIDSGSISGTSYSFNLANGTYSYTISSVAGYTVTPSSGSITVNGSNISKAITFSPIKITVVKYSVTFTESGLPSGTSWTLVFNGNTYLLTNTSYVFEEPNGTYSYSATSKDYKDLSGSVTVNGKSHSVTLSFVLQTYSVAFTESGLLSGSTWTLVFNGNTYTLTNTSYTFQVPNGTYSYSAESHDYKNLSGTVKVSGASQSIPLNFVLQTYSVTFSETDLPFGAEWYVNITESNRTVYDSGAISGSYYPFSLTNGSYTYSVSTSDHTYEPSPSSGSIKVMGKLVSESVTFSEVKYSITFTESGLPSGSTWYVNLTNGQTFSSTTDTISFSEPNGTYSYTIATADKVHEPSPSSGSFTVNGAAVSKSVAFSEVTYPVAFTESNLPSGSTWYGNITESNGTVYDSGAITGSSYSFSLTNGSYTYTIATSDKTYGSSASSGSFTVNGKPVSESIKFSKVFTVTFSESNLPRGTVWYVNLSNGMKSGAITGTTYSFSLTNGSYTYTITTSDKTYKLLSSSGSLTVNGVSASKSVSFSEVKYVVTFTESGLPSGTSWSVTLNGTTLSSKTSTITFSITNGTYSYSIGKISGYNISTSSGTLTVNGKNVTQSITFSSVPSTPTSNNDLYIIIGAVVAVAVIGAVVAIMVRKRK